MNSSVISDVIDGHDTANLVESIIKLEWNQFQQTNNEAAARPAKAIGRCFIRCVPVSS